MVHSLDQYIVARGPARSASGSWNASPEGTVTRAEIPSAEVQNRTVAEFCDTYAGSIYGHCLTISRNDYVGCAGAAALAWADCYSGLMP